MTDTPIPMQIADLVDELCDPRQHRERRWTWSKWGNKIKLPDHVTTQPGLLLQLHDAVHPAMASATDDAGSHRAPQSAPPLQLDALAAYLDITVTAADWCETLNIALRPTVQDNVRALAGARHTHQAQPLLTDLRRWRGAAATLTGWQSVITPTAPCPVLECEATQAGTLRVNLTNSTAICTTCRSWWDQTTIGLLAAHIATDQPRTRIPIRSGATGHGGWRSRETNGART